MKPAIVVVDMLKEFVFGGLKAEQAQSIISNIKRLLNFARERKIPIFYVCDAHEEGDFELRLWGPHAMKGSKNAEIVDELKPSSSEEVVIEKKTYSGFFGTNLAEILREKRIDTVILVGLHTHICVQHTAADAFYNGFNIIVPRDGTTAFTPEDHNAGINTMKTLYDAKITTIDNLLLELEQEQKVNARGDNN